MGEEDIVEEVQSTARSKKPSKAKCFICEANAAEFCIKGNPKDVYCTECAKEAFGETSYLEKL